MLIVEVSCHCSYLTQSIVVHLSLQCERTSSILDEQCPGYSPCLMSTSQLMLEWPGVCSNVIMMGRRGLLVCWLLVACVYWVTRSCTKHVTCSKLAKTQQKHNIIALHTASPSSSKTGGSIVVQKLPVWPKGYWKCQCPRLFSQSCHYAKGSCMYDKNNYKFKIRELNVTESLK